MNISCVTMYHGRNWTLPEAVESFRRQVIPKGATAELVIVNDCPLQEIRCECARVLNVMEFSDISIKTNFSVMDAAAEIVVLWDDDDICLPSRLSDICAEVNSGPDIAAWCDGAAWYSEHNEIKNYCVNIFPGAAWYRRDRFMENGGSKPNQPNDQSAFYGRGKAAKVVTREPNEVNYIYRWGNVGPHESAAKFRNGESRHDAFKKAVYADSRFKRGVIEVEPVWYRDYISDARRAVAREC